jgi:hypothetical protein
LEYPRIAIEEFRCDRDGLRMRPFLPVLENRFQVERVGTEDLQRPDVIVVGDQYGDVPPGHHPVVHPAAGVLHRVEDGRGDHVQPVPHIGFRGARSWPSDSA